ncbi:RNA-directed DNA polymerase [Streptococcus dysgalactiae]|uniref:RNA-directed DNA polymerase n=1 Tax=Streptococcus dysgalactiae TaxID=1334 RepID=UPI003D79C371
MELFSSEEVFRLLRTSKCTGSVGPDGLSPLLLKHGASPLTEVLTSFLSASLNNHCIPDCCRSVHIVPIPKSSNSDILSNRFRLIALTSSRLKLMERAILSRLQSSMNVPHDPFQFAYKSNRCTLDAVSSLVHRIAKSLNDSAKSVRCVFLDYSSAFDSVPRSLLLHKLETFGCPNSLLAWLSDYFSGRTQFTRMGLKSSKPLVNDSGVLQGAVLSPYLFSTFISDLSCTSPTVLFKYADDVVLCQSISNPSELVKFSDNLSNVHCFSNQHNVSLNLSKCSECVFSLSKSTNLSDPVFIDSEPLSRVSSIKYLGVTIDANLRWSSHIQCCTGKLRRLSFYIRKLRQYRVSQPTILTFVYQCIFPVVLYCSPVVFSGLLKKDFRLLRRGLSIISRVSFIPLNELIRKLCALHFTACEKFAHKILSDPSHPLYGDLSLCRSHPSTRSRFRCLHSRINLYKNSPVPYLARILTNKDRVVSEFLLNLGL